MRKRKISVEQLRTMYTLGIVDQAPISIEYPMFVPDFHHVRGKQNGNTVFVSAMPFCTDICAVVKPNANRAMCRPFKAGEVCYLHIPEFLRPSTRLSDIVIVGRVTARRRRWGKVTMQTLSMVISYVDVHNLEFRWITKERRAALRLSNASGQSFL